jgi:hypothetical protein
MGRFRQGSLARRVAITAFALYALLLQGFLAASAPAAAIAFPGGIECAQDGSGSGTSGGDPVRHHRPLLHSGLRRRCLRGRRGAFGGFGFPQPRPIVSANNHFAIPFSGSVTLRRHPSAL